MRTDDAMMAMIPMEKIPIRASLLLIGTRRLRSAGIGNSMITTSLSRLAAAQNTHSLMGSKHLTFGRFVFGSRSNWARYPAVDHELDGFSHCKAEATTAANEYMHTKAMVAFT